MMGNDPLDMNQYKRVFGTCRIPGIKRDGLEFHPNSTHIVVAYNNQVCLCKYKAEQNISCCKFNLQFFKVPVYNKDKCVISNKQLVCALKEVLSSTKKSVAPIGILTTEHRDTWGKVYKKLIQR